MVRVGICQRTLTTLRQARPPVRKSRACTARLKAAVPKCSITCESLVNCSSQCFFGRCQRDCTGFRGLHTQNRKFSIRSDCTKLSLPAAPAASHNVICPQRHLPYVCQSGLCTAPVFVYVGGSSPSSCKLWFCTW